MTDSNHRAVEDYRSYLLLLARMQLQDRAPGKLEASDMVQQTMLEAHVKRRQFSGDEEGFAAWLRAALANNIRDALRGLTRQKRDVGREQSLEEQIEQSSLRLANCLAVDQSSPSQRLICCEELLRLSDSLLSLPEMSGRRLCCITCRGCRSRKRRRPSARRMRRWWGCCIGV